ncbi:type II toxin-antitoxin system HicB family antitoxin, partial [Sporosarcina koreensis]|uniref:type II toxin-antitoxin system HicB family antitoxin n=1 Tax=Sporosarcina koreensis TaxID=334735 RepID=UPI001F1C3C7F
MLKDRYIYPALFTYADDGISVEFPDLPGCLTCADTDAEAIAMAKDALMLRLYSDESDGSVIPEPSKVVAIPHGDNQAVVLIDVW